MRNTLLLVSLWLCLRPLPLSAQVTQVEVRIIVVRTEGDAADVVKRLRGGATFVSVAQSRSIDPSAKQGGAIGIVPVTDLRREFQSALRGLAPGQVSPVFPLGGGFALLQLVSQKEAGNGALTDALTAGDIKKVTELLAAGADANLSLDEGYTVLMGAARAGQTEIVQALLKAGAKPAAIARNGATPLLEAAFAGQSEIVKILLLAGANPNARLDDGSTILMKAALNDKPEITRALLDAGVDVNARTPAGLTALMQASFAGQAAIARILMEAKADVNARLTNGSTALMAASLGGNAEIVRALLDAHADIRLGTTNGSTALMEAANAGHLDVVQLLLQAGSDVNATVNNGLTALMGAALGGHTEIVRALVAAGARVNMRDSKGWTAVNHAAASTNSGTVQALLDAGAAVTPEERALLLGGTYVNEYYASMEPRLLDLATTEFQRVLLAAPDNLAALEWSAAIDVLKWNGAPTLQQFQNTNALLKRTLALNPKDSERDYWIASTNLLFALQGKGAAPAESAAILIEGIDYARKAIESTPQYWEALACLSVLYRQKGDLAAADAASRDAIRFRDANRSRPTHPTDQFSTPAIPAPPPLSER